MPMLSFILSLILKVQRPRSRKFIPAAIGSTFSAKLAYAEASQTRNYIKTGYCNIPDPSKDNRPLGEDAWINEGESGLIAVADGVGGWSKIGVDTGIFTRELCSHVKRKYNALVEKE